VFYFYFIIYSTLSQTNIIAIFFLIYQNFFHLIQYMHRHIAITSTPPCGR